MKYKISKHAKKRIKERTLLDTQERKQIFRLALKNGKYTSDIKDTRIKRYMMSKRRFNNQVRLYRGYIFIYSKNKRQLYTMYKLPDELLEKEISYE